MCLDWLMVFISDVICLKFKLSFFCISNGLSLEYTFSFLSQELHQLLCRQDLTDFWDLRKGYIEARSVESDRNLNLNCEGLLEEVGNWLQLTGVGVNYYSTSVKNDCNPGAKYEVCGANNWDRCWWGVNYKLGIFR